MIFSNTDSSHRLTQAISAGQEKRLHEGQRMSKIWHSFKLNPEAKVQRVFYKVQLFKSSRRSQVKTFLPLDVGGTASDWNTQKLCGPRLAGDQFTVQCHDRLRHARVPRDDIDVLVFTPMN